MQHALFFSLFMMQNDLTLTCPIDKVFLIAPWISYSITVPSSVTQSRSSVTDQSHLNYGASIPLRIKKNTWSIAYRSRTYLFSVLFPCSDGLACFTAIFDVVMQCSFPQREVGRSVVWQHRAWKFFGSIYSRGLAGISYFTSPEPES